MKVEHIRDIANAVLFEGYLLYPYRHSAIKNRQRWSIGVIYPREYSQTSGGVDPWTMRTECLVTGHKNTTLDVTVRFLHLLTRRSVQAACLNTRNLAPAAADGASSTMREAHGDFSAQLGASAGAIGWAPDSWEEGMEREVTASALTLGDLLEQPRRIEFAYPAASLTEPRTEDARSGEVVREQQALSGAFTIAAEPVESSSGEVFKLTIHIENTTPLQGVIPDSYNAALLFSLVSAHTILQAQNGAFVSLLDPPDELSMAAASCHNERTYPVLVGDDGDTNAILSSPIILYDYPKIAPESAGSLFDGTEIDEILTLRILALTDEEKAEMREGDARAREILERTESLTAEQLMKLHGVIRSLGPSADRGNM